MSAAVWDQLDSETGTGLALDLKLDLIEMVKLADRLADRSQQTDLGPSEIGNPCTFHLGRRILGLPEEESDPWARTIGTATHGWLEEAAARWNVHHDRADWTAERKVYPDMALLPSGGSSDLFDVRRRSVVDHKVVGKPQQQKYRTHGPGPQYRTQVHLYGLGVTNSGQEVDHVAIAFWLRGGRLPDLYVWTEPYDEAVALEALSRYKIIRETVLTFGEAILDQLPRDDSGWCYYCS